MDAYRALAEARILEAMERGEFDDLPGRGKPLALDDDDPMVPGELRMAYRMLKNAGCLPPELELHQEVVRMRELLAAAEDDAERGRIRQAIEGRLLRLNLSRKRPFTLDDFPEYREKVERKLGR